MLLRAIVRRTRDEYHFVFVHESQCQNTEETETCPENRALFSFRATTSGYNGSSEGSVTRLKLGERLRGREINAACFLFFLCRHFLFFAGECFHREADGRGEGGEGDHEAEGDGSHPATGGQVHHRPQARYTVPFVRF